jgi:hypothetical protein
MQSKRLALSVLALFIPIVADAEHPFEGKWRLNVEKSVFASSDPRVKRATRFERHSGDAVVVHWESFCVNGERQTGVYTAKCDGHLYPVITSPPDVDAMACARINQFTARGNQFKDGTLIETYEQSVSGDGKVLTLKFFAIPPDYNHPKRILVYERH